MQEPRINPVFEIIKNWRDSLTLSDFLNPVVKSKLFDFKKKKKKDSNREEFPRCHLVP